MGAEEGREQQVVYFWDGGTRDDVCTCVCMCVRVLACLCVCLPLLFIIVQILFQSFFFLQMLETEHQL